MPTYEYACAACHHEWEEVQRISEPATELCPACKAKTAKRQISGGNFILKGGGWYADLYSSAKPSAKKEESSSSKSSESSKGSESPSAPAPSTPPAKTESKSAA